MDRAIIYLCWNRVARKTAWKGGLDLQGVLHLQYVLYAR